MQEPVTGIPQREIELIGDGQVKITPDMQANGGSGSTGAGGGLVEALVGLLVQGQQAVSAASPPPAPAAAEAPAA